MDFPTGMDRNRTRYLPPWKNWRQSAEERTSTIQVQQWIQKLEKGKAWLDEQRLTWVGIATEREKIMTDQQIWIAELEKSRQALEEQRRYWQGRAWGRDPNTDHWQTMACFTLRRFLLPAYRAAQGGHAHWLVALKNKVKRILFSAP